MQSSTWEVIIFTYIGDLALGSNDYDTYVVLIKYIAEKLLFLIAKNRRSVRT